MNWVGFEENVRRKFEPIAQTEIIRLILERKKNN